MEQAFAQFVSQIQAYVCLRVPAIIGVRSASSSLRDGMILGKQAWPVQVGDAAPALPLDMEVIVYCACPCEVSAAKVARLLHQARFRHVQPLLGGIDSWIAASLPMERGNGG